ncbi:hypothetical protein NW762_008843 [Fusarium torreyae]|uniref:Uncharacterized protein n=1 Tax=Fusarium torreyae TaxID=1237075 RepID=A0A9W8RWI3_9HYPO|nr:hypothetical protein NW762_008843 [Fusarium torreyae]
MPDPQDNRESAISDPMVPLYQQVAEAQRQWHNAQITIAGLKGAQEVMKAQNRELRDENNQLRLQLARVNEREKEGQSNPIGEGGGQKRRRMETVPEPLEIHSHKQGLVSEVVETYDNQLSVPVEGGNGDKRPFSTFSRLCNPGPNNDIHTKNLLRFAGHGKMSAWYCFREVCEKNDLTVTAVGTKTSKCPVHDTGCKIAVKRQNNDSGSKLTFRAFKEAAQTAH